MERRRTHGPARAPGTRHPYLAGGPRADSRPGAPHARGYQGPRRPAPRRAHHHRGQPPRSRAARRRLRVVAPRPALQPRPHPAALPAPPVVGRRRGPPLPAGAVRLVPHFAVSAVGADRPGIVAAVTGAFLEHGCNLEDTSMTILRGHFAMMLVVAAPEG